MTLQHDGYNWIVRLNKGEKLIEQLTNLVKEEKIPSCWISGLGGAESAKLGFYDLGTKKYNWQTIREPLEILSLQGNIAWQNGELVLHIHGALSRADMQAIGGHVKELTVSGTCEVYLHKWYGDDLQRKKDDQTGLGLLDL